jgi:hypothetical protein
MKKIIKSFVNYGIFLVLSTCFCNHNKPLEFIPIRTVHYQVQINKNKEEQIDKEINELITQKKQWGIEDVIYTAAVLTSKHLNYDFLDLFQEKKDRNYFSFPLEVKTTNCIDYCFLYSTIFEKLKQKTNLRDYDSYIIAGNVNFFGKKIPHQWIKIKNKKGDFVRHVDPVLFDYLRIIYVNGLLR